MIFCKAYSAYKIEYKNICFYENEYKTGYSSVILPHTYTEFLWVSFRSMWPGHIVEIASVLIKLQIKVSALNKSNFSLAEDSTRTGAHKRAENTLNLIKERSIRSFVTNCLFNYISRACKRIWPWSKIAAATIDCCRVTLKSFFFHDWNWLIADSGESLLQRLSSAPVKNHVIPFSARHILYALLYKKNFI